MLLHAVAMYLTQVNQSCQPQLLGMGELQDGYLQDAFYLVFVLRALRFALPAEAAKAVELFQSCQAPSQQLQQAFFEKLCSEAAVPTAFDQLQAHQELAGRSRQPYSLLIKRLSPGQVSCSGVLSPVRVLSFMCTHKSCLLQT